MDSGKRNPEKKTPSFALMRIAIYTLTRDRFEFTKHCFETLWEKADYQYDHYIVDNGSEDETKTWLAANVERFKRVLSLPKNIGISKGSNVALGEIFKQEYDIVAKFDNDCEVITPKILSAMT